MGESELIPAACYLRMSTDRQQYSLLHQSEVVAEYAASHDFVIVKTYSDAARTGVIFRKRKGLQSLIQDVVQGRACYKAVLVYDVSRWGRFQDADESAHYEFLCKSAGIPIHYCAEPFSNDTDLSSLIMKSLKRVMAAEYSRELGVKIFNAQRRLASMGFRQGGQPGYGLRRLLVSADGTPKEILLQGQRKSIATDRVIQIPGTPEEVACVREMYRLFVEERVCFVAIAKELNRRGIPYLRGKQWDQRAIKTVLTHPKYAGVNQYGRFSAKLYTPKVENPRSQWTFAPQAFEPVVDPNIFKRAQEIIATFTWNKSDETVLGILKALLVKQGRLNMNLIEHTPEVPSVTTIRSRFGSISRAYELVGYDTKDGYSRRGRLEELRNIRRMRQALMEEIVSLSKGSVKIENRGARFRTCLRLRNGRRIAVVVSRHIYDYKNSDRWRFRCVAREYRLVTLIARLNRSNDAFMDFFVVPPLRSTRWVRLFANDSRLNMTIRLHHVGNFLAAVEAMSKSRSSINWALTEKSTAIATKNQLKRIAMLSQCELIRRGMNQKTLQRIYALKPVRPSKLAKCLKMLEQ